MLIGLCTHQSSPFTTASYIMQFPCTLSTGVVPVDQTVRPDCIPWPLHLITGINHTGILQAC